MITRFEILSYASNKLPCADVTMILLCFLPILLLFYYNYYFHKHNYYASMMNTFESDYPFGNCLESSNFDELSEYLQSHFQKKNVVDDISKGNIPMHSLILCCRWDTNSIYNIFSYIFTYLSNDMRCGKTLSHWFLNISNDIYVVFPPILDNIKTEPYKVKLFVNSLPVQKTEIIHNTKLKRIIYASVLGFHGVFLGIIGNEPSGKYKDPNHHPFYQKIMSSLSETSISK